MRPPPVTWAFRVRGVPKAVPPFQLLYHEPVPLYAPGDPARPAADSPTLSAPLPTPAPRLPRAAPISSTSPYVWPTHSWALSTLTLAQRASWEHDGFLIVPNVINASVAAAAASAIRTFVGANDSELASWYANTLDIYEDRTPSGARPHHGPCGMVNLCHHQAIWTLRQEPKLHGVFADLYGTRRLYVTIDRQHFKPPQNPAYPAWSDAGAVHTGLHWDVDTRRAAWPVPYVLQGTLLTTTLLTRPSSRPPVLPPACPSSLLPARPPKRATCLPVDLT